MQRKLNTKKVFVLLIALIILVSGIFIRSHTFISAKRLKLTINQRVKYEFNNDILTIYIPINADVEDYKVSVGTRYFQNQSSLASKMVQSLDTSTPFELIGTVVVDQTPLTLQFIVE